MCSENCLRKCPMFNGFEKVDIHKKNWKRKTQIFFPLTYVFIFCLILSGVSHVSSTPALYCMLCTRVHVEKSILSSAWFICFPHSNQRNTLAIIRRYCSLKSTIVDDLDTDFVNETPNKISNPETYSVLKAPGLQHWFKNWQELRRHKLTASTFGGAIGLWRKRRVKLWLEKIGAVEPFSGNLATCWTNIKEEEALARYKLITGNSVAFPRFQVYQKENYPEKEDWLAASPDGIVIESEDGLGLRGVLEIKCPFFGGDMTQATPWKRVPLYYIPQAQGLMEILDRDWVDFYVWTPKGSSLFRLYRDEEYWGVLKEALSDFWWNHVHPAREICDRHKIVNPRIELSSYVPEPRHKLCTTIIHRSQQLVNQSDLLIREINGVLQN